MFCRFFQRILKLGPLAMLLAGQLPAASLRVVAMSNLGDELRPEIHLYQLGSHKDVWPNGHKQVSNGVAPGWYRIEASLPGCRRFERDLEIFGKDTALRVIMTPAMEASGELTLYGNVTHIGAYSQLWMIAFPLEGPPGDTVQSAVTAKGTFKIVTIHGGAFLLALVRGADVLATRRVYIGAKNAEIEIEAKEPRQLFMCCVDAALIEFTFQRRSGPS